MIDRDRSNDVLAGFCHNGDWTNFFGNSLLAAFAEDSRRSRRRLVEYHDASGPYIHDNRARIARYFLEHTDYQWLWMLDNDIQFPPESLYMLLSVAEEQDLKIVGAAYWNQYPPSATYLSWLVFTPHGIKAIPELPLEQELIEVDAVGMGCTLIHRDALRDVAECYPNDPWDTFGADILVTFEDGSMQIGRTPEDIRPDGREIEKVDRMGEDVTFCLRARKCGYSVYGLSTLLVEHFKPHFVRPGLGVDRENELASVK